VPFRLNLRSYLGPREQGLGFGQQMALCVLVKTKEPKIEWHVSARNSADLIDYLAKAGYVSGDSYFEISL
jgi:hypothetical protein